MKYHLIHSSIINYHIHWSTIKNKEDSTINPTPQWNTAIYCLCSTIVKNNFPTLLCCTHTDIMHSHELLSSALAINQLLCKLYTNNREIGKYGYFNIQ